MKKYIKEWKDFFVGKSVEQCYNEVEKCNLKNLRSFSIVGIVMMIFASVFGQFTRNIITFNSEFLIMLAYCVFMRIINTVFKRVIKHATLIFYLWIIPLMLLGIMMGTFLDPNEPSITIMVFLCVLPMFILDKPWRIVLFIFLNAIIYTICCFYAKTTVMFVADMIDLILFTALGIGVNCLILKERIHNVEYSLNMKAISETDSLTLLYNRGAGEAKIRELLEKNIGGMFFIIDIDDFKKINDYYGHAVGDEVIKATANHLQRVFRKDDIIMRFGGDEFAIFASRITYDRLENLFIERLIKKPYDIPLPENSEYDFSISIGITYVDEMERKDFDVIYRESDMALYAAKSDGKGKCVFYNDSFANSGI